MCLQDLWIGRHTKANRIGNGGGVVQITPNPLRVALIFDRTFEFTLSDPAGNEWYSNTGVASAASFNTTMTNNAVPTGNTGTITPTSVFSGSPTLVLDVRVYGVLVQQGGSYQSGSQVVTCWELVADKELADAWDALGWRKFPELR